MNRRDFLKRSFIAGAAAAVAACGGTRGLPNTPQAQGQKTFEATPTLSRSQQENKILSDELRKKIEHFDPSVRDMITTMLHRFGPQTSDPNKAEYSETIRVRKAGQLGIDLRFPEATDRQQNTTTYSFGGCTLYDKRFVDAPILKPDATKNVVIPIPSIAIKPDNIRFATSGSTMYSNPNYPNGVPCFNLDFKPDMELRAAICPNIQLASMESMRTIFPNTSEEFLEQLQMFFLTKECCSLGLMDLCMQDITHRSEKIGSDPRVKMHFESSGEQTAQEVVSIAIVTLFNRGGYTQAAVDVAGYLLAINQYRENAEILNWITTNLNNQGTGQNVVDLAIKFDASGTSEEMMERAASYMVQNPILFTAAHVGNEQDIL